MFHTIIIVGNLGREPEMRYLPSGQAVCDFSIATSKKYTSANGQKVEETIWVRISAWGKLAETCSQFLHKGSKVLVEGQLRPDPATGSPRVYTKKDGTVGATYEVTAQTVRFLSSKGEDGGSGAYSGGGDYGGQQMAESEDNIPF